MHYDSLIYSLSILPFLFQLVDAITETYLIVRLPTYFCILRISLLSPYFHSMSLCDWILWYVSDIIAINRLISTMTLTNMYRENDTCRNITHQVIIEREPSRVRIAPARPLFRERCPDLK